jgi:two-component system response regulator FixJ
MPVVHVVDDDDGVRDSLKFLLEGAGLRVATYSNGRAVLAADLPQEGCVLTDFRMPGMDGLELQSRLSELGVALPVIIMTGHGEVPLAVRALKAGAVDFLLKPFDEAQLVEAVRRALDTNRAARAASIAAAEAAEKLALLTPREHEVLDLLVTGKSNKEIAKMLGNSPRTVDVHRARVFEKLQAANLPDLVHLVLAAQPSR